MREDICTIPVSEGFEPLDGCPLCRMRAIAQKRVIDFITSMMDGVKENLDYAVIANMIKIIVFSYEQNEMLHASGFKTTMDRMVDLLIDSIFEI